MGHSTYFRSMPHPHLPEEPALLALDWGTTSLRAWSLDLNGAILSWTTSGDGLRTVRERATVEGMNLGEAFAGTLAGLRERLGATETPALACGMIGADDGWWSAGRLTLPVPAEAGAFRPAEVPGTCPVVSIVPGLRTAPDATSACDVIRGEEAQVLGALARLGHPAEATLVMPGTHTKWLRVAEGKIVDFTTAMTGELHAALLAATILGDPARHAGMDSAGPAEIESEAFDAGLRHSLSHPGQPLAAGLFSARTRHLTGELAPAAVASYLSGLLIGDETAAMLPAARAFGAPMALCADGPLGGLYQRALSVQGADMPVLQDTALDGLRVVARAWGLLPDVVTPVTSLSSS